MAEEPVRLRPIEEAHLDTIRRVEADHGRLKARLRPMRGRKQDRSARVIIAGHASIQNLRRGHYKLAVEEPTNRPLVVSFDELVLAI
jgi:transposase, IS6 family